MTGARYARIDRTLERIRANTDAIVAFVDAEVGPARPDLRIVGSEPEPPPSYDGPLADVIELRLRWQ